MTEGLAFEPEDEETRGLGIRDDEPAGWVVYGPAGELVAAGGQTATEASAGAGQET